MIISGHSNDEVTGIENKRPAIAGSWRTAMCDTLTIKADWSESGVAYFAKNSDRSPNEPHIIIRIPGMWAWNCAWSEEVAYVLV